MEKWKNWLAILVGSAIMAFGINFFNIANGMAEGGITGITILLKYLFGFDPGLTNLLLNLPLFYLAWKYFGKISFFYTVYGNVSVSVFLYLFRETRFQTDDVLLASLFAGLSMGIGLGIVLRFGGTTGGTDILAQLLQRHLGWPIGKSLLLFDILVIGLSLIYLDKESAMYTIVAVYVGARVIDIVQEGAYRAKAAVIISDNTELISKRILTELGRGTTLLSAKGGYSGHQRELLYCVVSRSEMVKLKTLVYQTDPLAFVILNDVAEVLGEGFNTIELAGVSTKSVSS